MVDGSLTGAKTRVLNGQSSDLLLCVARRDSGALGVALIPRYLAGVEVEAKRAMDLHGYANVSFNGINEAHIEWLEGDSVDEGITKAIDQATIVLAAEDRKSVV